MSRISWCWVGLFLLAVGLWSVHIRRPVDLPNWHEFDYSSIARNFVREGNNILLPRIDWRGDGPGFTEMEFPIIPWIMAQLYLVFGMHEIIGRILSLVFALLSLWVFRQIALKVLPELAAVIAALFLIVSHEMVIVATAIQPESLMLLLYLLAVFFFIRWYESKGSISYALAICSFAFAMLVKSPAAHLAIFFFAWALIKDGLTAFRRPSLYLFAALSFALPLLWYWHASSLWHQFHNSMGVSNEDHWVGLDIIRRPKVIANLVSIDFMYVFGCGGVLVVLAALARDKFKSAVNRLALSWCLAVAVYLVVIIRTAGANWAAYYHVVAVPPVALLFGAGVYQVSLQNSLSWQRITLCIAAPALALIGGLSWIEQQDTTHMPGVVQDFTIAQSGIPMLLVLTVLSLTVTVVCFSLTRLSSHIPASLTFVQASVVIGCFIYFLVSFQLMLGSWTTFGRRSPEFRAAANFRSKIAAGALIVTSGGICRDAGGHRVANDAPNMFYWLDRKGFTTCEGHQSIRELESYKDRGARYFIAGQSALQAQPGFETELRKYFLLLAESNGALVFSLRSR